MTTAAQLLGTEKQIVAALLDGVTPDMVQQWHDHVMGEEVSTS